MAERRLRGEFQLISELFAPLAANAWGALGLGDDACLVRPDPGFHLVVTADALIAGVHFLRDDPPETVGRKLLRVNLSDLAAMGAHPIGYVLTVILGAEHRGEWMDAFVAGLRADQEEFGLDLLGGDTVATPGPSTFCITAFGQARQDAVLRRNGARAGDSIYISGTIGDGGFGLLALRDELPDLDQKDRDALVRRYRLPIPRLQLGQCLSHIASAAIDISDGLIADLEHVCDSSGAGAEIVASQVPMTEAVASAVRSMPQLRSRVLSGGDDYELLVTIPPHCRPVAERLAIDAGTPIRQIGGIVDTPGVRCVGDDGSILEIQSGGYTHF